MSNNRSFKSKVIRNLVLSLVLTVVAIFFIALFVHIATFYKTLEDYNKTSSHIIKNFIYEQINEIVRDLNYLSKSLNNDKKNNDTLLMKFMTQYQHYSSIWIADSNGIILNVFPDNEYLTGTDKSGSDVFHEIKIWKRKFAVSAVFFSPESNLSSFDIAIPIKNNKMMSVTISASIFTDHLTTLNEGTSHLLMLTDKHASWLSHNDSKKIKQREVDPDFSKYSKLEKEEYLNIISKNNDRYFLRFITPLKETKWFLSIQYPIEEIIIPIIIMSVIILLISFPIIGFSFGISFRVIKKIFKPMDNFVSATEKIGQGDYHYSLPSTGYIEFDQVKSSLTKMVENIDTRESEQKELWMQLLQSQKMEAIGSLASGVAHDFNNLLTAIGGYSDIISINFDEESREMAYINEVNKAVDRATALTRQLLAFSRKDKFKTEKVCVNEVIDGILKMLHRIVGEEIVIKMNLDKNLPQIQADPHQFEQILLNLTVNSRDALNETRTKDPFIEIKTDGIITNEINNVKYVKILISDNGPGIPEGIRDHIFDSFFTTKEKGKGTGLGLSTVKGIIEQNNAEIEVGDSSSGGALFTILWPIDNTDDVIVSKEVKPLDIGFENKNVIYVDDEKILCEIASEVLKKLNHNVVVANNGEEAFNQIESKNGDFDLLITDVIMPKMGGPELAKSVQNKWPNIKVLFVSGYVDDRIEKSGIDVNGINFLRKPFNMSSLKNSIHKIFNS